ncbi:zinc ribbon protein [Desulfobotulus alkaliphilus]|uniref:Zinc ribbon protein n=1 Tax=Desulfobotulus alkaliphilus TaxID=622671 RepID=A0A562RGC3_9BACT|nr:zinc-ribbon domain-containing protein [Desulfobotulus alkaliphilus]TWI68122.1 zinc ribbon protein [Desulfobotulus alkaliphilus]
MAGEDGMVLVCEGCDASFRIPEGKVPPGKTVGMTCPKCWHRSSFTAPSAGNGWTETEDSSGDVVESASAKEDERKSFSSLVFAEEEGELALICVEDPQLQGQIQKALELMEYQVIAVKEPHEALKNLRMHTCKLVMVHEAFGGGGSERNPVLLYLERLPMSMRREMFAVMLSERHSTLDSLMAFIRSVNMVMNVRHLPDLEGFLRQGLADHQRFYEVFLDALRESGRV